MRSGDTRPCFAGYHSQSQAALQGAVGISLFCTALLDGRQGSMFPPLPPRCPWGEKGRHFAHRFPLNTMPKQFFSCCSSVFVKEVGCRFAYCIPFNHTKRSFLVKFDSSQRRVQGVSNPCVLNELTEDGESLGTTLRPNSKLPHCCRECRDYSFNQREELVIIKIIS